MWVSVKDRLPEDDVWVRCKTREGKIIRAMYCGKLHSTCWFTRNWEQPGALRTVYGITHWWLE